jgi:threonine dehydratase
MNPVKAPRMPSPADIRAALARIAPYIQRTPVLTAQLPGLGYPIEIKLENCQITGSFKARGAFNTLLSGPVRQSRGRRGDCGPDPWTPRPYLCP